MGSPEPHSADRLRRQYSFGEFTLDLDGGFLRRGADEVALRPKPFEVLVYLVEHHGRLVTKGELTEAVWPDTAVMDNSLAQCLVEIRRALGDDSQQLIRTVARRGYLFTAPVATPVVEFPRLPASTEAARGPVPLSPEPATGTLRKRHVFIGAFALVVLIGVALPLVWPTRTGEQQLTYTQITSFTDSAVSPALSPDGKMLAFIRSDNWFLTPDQIYVKLLPSGEPVQLTRDPRPKYGLGFSPDGSRITYTVAGPWSTYVVSPLGGEPTLLLSNSSGVTWLDQRRILFSEVNPPRSIHMGVVTALEDRSEQRTIYFPQDERGMVHLSYASPDRKWALALEMNPVWQPCRLIRLDGSSFGRQVGPKGSCTSAAWSPDGKWMYFGVEVTGNHHLWRQRFPDGQPEQITFGPTEEGGMAVAPDGRSLITSIGMRQSALWIHDAHGDRALSSQGYVPHPESTGMSGTIPVFSRDGKSIFYLKSESPGAPTELWRTDVASGKSDKALPGIFMVEFDVSDDAKEVLYSVRPPGKPLELWVGTLDRRSPPQLISTSGEDSPYFGSDGRIVYRSFDGTNYYLSGGTFAVLLAGGAPRRICSGCPVTWSLDGKALYLFVRKSSLTDPGKTRVVPLQPGEILPKMPPSGMRALGRTRAFSRLLPHRRIWNLARSGPLRLRVRENHNAPESLSDPLALERRAEYGRRSTTSSNGSVCWRAFAELRESCRRSFTGAEGLVAL